MGRDMTATTPLPVPEIDDGENHVYVSVGHQQMMTHAMKPLGLSFWQMTTPRPMAEAGGRLFVDVTRIIASPTSRSAFLDMAGKSDPLIRDALQTVIDRGDLVRESTDDAPGATTAGDPPTPVEPQPAEVDELIAESEASIAALQREVRHCLA